MKRLPFLLLIIICSFQTIAFAQDAATTPLHLKEAFAKALLRSETVKIKEEDIRIAEAHSMQAWGSILPHVSFRATEFLQDTSGATSDGTSVTSSFTRRSRPEAAIVMSQPIFQGLREYQALRVAGAEKQRNKFEKRRAQELLFSDVTKAYYSVIQLEKEHEILKSLFDVTQKRLKEITGRIRLGKSRDTEMFVADSQAATLEADMAKSEAQILMAREVLAFFIGDPVPNPLVDEFQVPASLPPIEQSLANLENRADIKAANEDVKLARGKVGYEQGGHLPDVRLDANYYPYRVGYQQDIKWDMLFTANVPIFSGGATAGRVKEAKAISKQTELMREEKKRSAQKDIRQIYASLMASQKMEKALKNAETKSGSSYQAQTDEYRLGLVNNLEVLQAMKDWQQLRIEANMAHYQTKLDFLNLKVTEGHLPLVEDLLLTP